MAGCARETPNPPVNEAQKGRSSAPPPKRVTDRPANEQGVIFIVEYHKIAEQEARWDRSTKRFREDLERFYKMGFRPVTLRDAMQPEIALPPGASPIVFTFDDSHVTQFRYLPDGSIDPNCAVGIWQAFAEKHPDFPVVATFLILPPVPFGQKDYVADKLAELKKWGCEIGSHTLTHRNLSKLSATEAKKELSGSKEWLRGLDVPATSLALPYGINPKDKSLLDVYDNVLLVGANPAPSAKSGKLNRKAIPRIQGIEGEMGITYWLDQVEKGAVKPYVAP